MVDDTGGASPSLTPVLTTLSEPAVLVTKVTVPPVRPVLLPREHLLRVLDQSCSVPLTLLSASAGFGKTTLLSAWASQRPNQVAWLSLDEQDSDPSRFWTHVLAALRRTGAPVSEATLALVHASHHAKPAGALAALINDLAALQQDTTLVLHDYHLVSEPTIHESLQFLLDHVPVRLHLLLASRVDPPLALARMRARGQLIEIRDADLRLSNDEAGRFLNDIMGLSLSEEAISHLERRTEGWIAGLQLAALALRRHTDVSAFLQAFTGSQRGIQDYVYEEILVPLPKGLQQFLLQVSVLERLHAELCQALTGEPTSQQRLEMLERANLFLLPLDEERHWYRFHALFRDVLLARLQVIQPEQVPVLHQRAADWYAAHGSLYEAIPHALAAENYESAADLLERYIVPQHWRNEYHLLRRWVTLLPQAMLYAHPGLSITYVTAVVLTSPRGPKTLERMEAPLRQAEADFRARGDQAALGTVLAMRAVLTWQQGAFPQAFTLARQALAVLPEEELQWRGHGLGLVGSAEVLAGQMTRGQEMMRQALALHERVESLPGMQYALASLGDACLNQGALHLAEHYFRQALATSEKHRVLAQMQLILETGEHETYYERMAQYGLATLAYEWNDLETAEQLLREALAGPSEWQHILTGGVLVQVRLLLAQGAAEKARAVLADLAVQASQPEMLWEIQMCQAYLALEVGDLVIAQRWAASAPLSPAPMAITHQEEETLLLARVHLAAGEAEAALRILADFQQKARTEERHRSELHLLVLESLAHQAMGAMQKAREALLQALALGRPEGYQRLFVDEGQNMERLLKDLMPSIREEAVAAYARTLLRTFARATAYSQHASSEETSSLPSRLTPQEQRVLRLLAEGATNQDIADHLVVQLSTAKKHVANILSKLGAENRTQAIARAREDGLL